MISRQEQILWNIIDYTKGIIAIMSAQILAYVHVHSHVCVCVVKQSLTDEPNPEYHSKFDH